ncbi:MAG TPA: TIGR04190 family B12-binding domain/radical SAM domain protein [Euryarchaeota archaeon]|nr:TIGR04190 family B12-binding domain/radical SAM domain protein [Euryarchaeota archaeon]
MRIDLALLHAPSIFNFREKPILWGPINDLVPSTPVFEMYPMGFVSIASILEKKGYKIAIVNIALRMLSDKKFDPEKYISKIDARLFGIDLHWMPHVHGAINLARIVKKVHPNTPIVFGGLSSSYFYREILRDVPEVDFVLRGDSTEEPFIQLMEALDKGNFEKVANLSYRKEGRIKENPMSYVPSTLDDYSLDYEYSLRAFTHSKHRLDTVPFKEFIERPIMAVLTRKGCESNCIACGGSSYTYKNTCNRPSVAFRSVEKVVKDIKKIEEFKTPAFILGDLALHSEEYGLEILKGIRKEGVDIPLIFEFFYPPSRRFLEEMGRSVDNFTIEMSPEAGDEEVRMKIGRVYNNNSLKKMVSQAFSNNCRQFDLYFMVGLGFQDRKSVEVNATLAESLVKENSGNKLLPFVSPYAPFLDPGSLAFESPEKYGYKKRAFTLFDHYNLLERGNTWKEFLSYSTNYLSRDEIVKLSYTSALDFADIKKDAGLIDIETYNTINHRIEVSRRVMGRIEEAKRKGERIDEEALMVSLEELSERVTINREELDWSRSLKVRRMFSLAFKLIKSLF